MAKLLYLNDSYLKEFDAVVERVEEQGGKAFVFLDETIFYPTGGGQPSDIGVLKRGADEFKVISCSKKDGNVAHEVEALGLKQGDKVRGSIDWNRRYKLMKMHTCAHLLGEVIYRKKSALTTGNQLNETESRIDSSLSELSEEEAKAFISETNALLAKNLEVKAYNLQREEAMKIPGVVKLAMGLPEGIREVRIVDIGGYDVQADGGTHVKNTSEVGKMEFVKIENKGAGKKRIYFKLAE